MPIEINHSLMHKLTHEVAEIRLRSFEQVEGKILRALAHNENITFKPGELCKQLIRWFGYIPLQVPGKVLELMARILRSKYGNEAIERLGLERFKREIDKVQNLLHHRVDELQIVGEILMLLNSRGKQMVATNNEVDVVELLNAMRLNDNAAESAARVENFSSGDFVLPWSAPKDGDVEALERIAHTLVNPQTPLSDLLEALQRVQLIVVDYPAEFLLQPPNIYLNVLQLFARVDELNCPLEDVATTLLVVLRQLKIRLRERRMCTSFAMPRTQVNPKRTQLGLAKALQLLMQHVMRHLQHYVLEFGNEATYLFDLLASALDVYRIQHLCVDTDSVQRLYTITQQLADAYVQADNVTLQRVRYVLLSFLLQDVAANNAKRQPLHDGHILLPLLRDYAVRANYPKRHEQLLQMLIESDPALRHAEHRLQQYVALFATAMLWLKEPRMVQSSDIIARGADVCVAVDRLQSMKLAEQLFDAVVDSNIVYPGQRGLRQQATQLLVRLLQLRHLPLKARMYDRLAYAMKRHFACLMNGTCYASALPNETLLAAQIVGVPLSTELLLQLIRECQPDSDGANTTLATAHGASIAQHCVDMLSMLLKAQHLFAEHWEALLELLLPVLPLLAACAQAGNKLLPSLLHLYNPDAQHALPFLAMLQGNVGLLFHSDGPTRSEALTRLVYIMDAMPGAHEYVPNLMEVCDLVPNDLCYVQPPRDVARVFAHTEIFSDRRTLHTLLGLLGSDNIEPLIRKTTMMQLNVMCHDWEMTAEFCDESGFFLLLNALEQAMRRQSLGDYSETAIPAISVLCKVLLYDTECCRQLAETPNFYVLLLRALMLYQHDIQVRQDASVCLMQLLYVNYVVVLPGGRGVQVPPILANLNLPLRCEFVGAATASNDSAAYGDLFRNSSEETAHLRLVLAASYCEGSENAAEIITNQYLTAQNHMDFCDNLRLTDRDWRLWRATAPTHLFKRCMKIIANATDHNVLLNAVTMLRLLLRMCVVEHGSAQPDAFDDDIFKLLSKYIHLPPGNEMDFVLYEHLMDLGAQCVTMALPAVTAGLVSALRMDGQHALLLLLRNEVMPLRLFSKICRLLTLVLRADMDGEALTAAARSLFYSTLFVQLLDIAKVYLDKCDLYRLRGLLVLLQTCSKNHLGLSDVELVAYCKHFIKLAVAVKAFTYTGSQLQRDCLLQICQLHAQLREPMYTFWLNSNTLKFLIGMCGHKDAYVRVLAWGILSHVARFVGNGRDGARGVIDSLSYLPGGFIACCVVTLLDPFETMRVRHVAGELCAALLRHVSEPLALLHKYSFFNEAFKGVDKCYFEAMLPVHFDYATVAKVPFITCEMVSVYCHICQVLLTQWPNLVGVLFNKPVMFKLYGLLKLPPAHSNPAYHAMCAHICKLYTTCYQHYSSFVQRTLCQDQVWLASFCNLLRQPGIAEEHFMELLRMLRIASRDTTAHKILCENFITMPDFVVQLFMRTLDVPLLRTEMQEIALAVLTALLNVSPPEFLVVLQLCVDVTPRQQLQPDSNNNNSHQNVTNCPPSAAATTRRREPTNVPLNMRRLRKRSALTPNSGNAPIPEKIMATETATTEQRAAVASYICQDLYRLFNHMYSSKECKFVTSPSPCAEQICVALSSLLHYSKDAQIMANDQKLLDRFLRIFKTFFEETNIPCSTFVRRYGETRKRAVVENFQVLLRVLLNWHLSPTALSLSELCALELNKVLIQIWPWLAHSNELKLLQLRLCDTISRTSMPMCRRFSTQQSGYTNSVLHLIVKMVVSETTKVKAASSDHFEVIEMGLRVLINCCACPEGRAVLLKERVLDIFDGMYPFNPKLPKVKLNILVMWMNFWMSFSAHADGAKLCNLNGLCMIIQNMKSDFNLRMCALHILNNMCQLSANRTHLVDSENFLNTCYKVLGHPIYGIRRDNKDCECYSYQELLLITMAVQQLVAGGVRYVAMMRSSKLEKKFQMLREHLQMLKYEEPNLFKFRPYITKLEETVEELLKRFNSL